MLYSKYLAVITTEDLSHLIISGNPSQIELIEAWKNIQDDYSDSIKHPKSTTVFEAGRKLVYTQWKLDFVSLCIELLKSEYDAEIAGKLADLGYDYIEPKEDREEYLKQIYGVETEAKFLIIQLNQLNADYKRISGENATPVKRQMVDYEKELRILSKFMGYSIKKECVTVMEFVSILNAYIEEIESIKSTVNE